MKVFRLIISVDEDKISSGTEAQMYISPVFQMELDCYTQSKGKMLFTQ